jgi:hypothetical protein
MNNDDKSAASQIGIILLGFVVLGIVMVVIANIIG